MCNRLKELGWQPVCSTAELKQIELKKELPKPVVDKFNIATKAIHKATQEATDIFVRLGNEVPNSKAATPRLHIKAQIRVLNGVADDFKSILTFGENLAGEKLDFEGQCTVKCIPLLTFAHIIVSIDVREPFEFKFPSSP